MEPEVFVSCQDLLKLHVNSTRALHFQQELVEYKLDCPKQSWEGMMNPQRYCHQTQVPDENRNNTNKTMTKLQCWPPIMKQESICIQSVSHGH